LYVINPAHVAPTQPYRPAEPFDLPHETKRKWSRPCHCVRRPFTIGNCMCSDCRRDTLMLIRPPTVLRPTLELAVLNPQVVDVNLLVMSASLLLPTLLSLHTACTLHRRLNRRMRIHCMDLNRRRVRRPTYKTSPGNKLPGSEGVVAQINSLHGHAQKMDSVEEINLLLKGTFDEST